MSEADIRDIIEGVRSGKYSLDNLPYELFKYTSNELISAFEEGWQTTELSNPDIDSIDHQLFQSFKENLWYFSGNKTAAQVAELQALMHDEQGNRRSEYDFTKDALKVDKTFNRQYLSAEYDLTFKLAQSGREWQEIEDTKETFPFLEWVTVMDDNTRHGKFNGIKLPVDHPFWSSHPQPLEWGCRCRKRQLQQATATAADVIADIPTPPQRPWHANVYREQEIWKNREHPYGAELTKPMMAGVAALTVKATDALPFTEIYRAKNGRTVNYHPRHVLTTADLPEMERNIRSAKVMADNGHDVELLPNYKGAEGRKSPDVRIDGKHIADFKTCNEKQIIRRINEASKQNATIVVFQMDDSVMTAEQAGRRVKGNMHQIDERIEEVWFDINGQLIKTGREVRSTFVAELIKAESAKP